MRQLAASPSVRAPRPQRLPPCDPGRGDGPSSALTASVARNAVGTVCSLIHILAPHSGANTIASVPTEGDAGRGVVALLAQWGGSQLLERLVIWVVVQRYRELVPFMLGVIFLEQVLRLAIGRGEPVPARRAAPGAVATRANRCRCSRRSWRGR
jgi:hypothetical protein